ncbi:methylated-DNA--[protein]-cysteine S-methyltransferase [Brevibacillus agri]|uniref:methylated-DNA--[protein]-cysteine S-methyltransferase n=1 Tax=Brevibacillus agri TaxID=51101 RepID=UPI0018CF6574|nr:methylated-DNA--[protein]-cysteine S-methyltransferase [Brevibacillus agri]MBG9565993.1 cysteine methyltransferase [Brevibacillus agri]
MKEKQHVYWSKVILQEWSLHLAATAKGLCFVGSQNGPFAELSNWFARRRPGHVLVQDHEQFAPYVAEISEYLQGARQQFSLALDLEGTPFQLSVWDALCRIPYGQTTTYSEIAAHIKKPAAVRAVGAAIGANPLLLTVPCHRVVSKDGSLTGYRGGLDMKTALIALEKGSLARGMQHG